MPVIASAPGRVNLIGEHTDYNGGFVLPIATPQTTTIELRRRSDSWVHAWSRDVPEPERSVAFMLGRECRTGGWSDYVAGVTQALLARGIAVCGFDARVSSSLPLGAGLSSSAALEVALVRAIDRELALGLDPLTIAKIAHAAETGLVGAPVGIMDQMAASLADADRALFIDTRSLQFERLPLPAGTALVVIHSGTTHRHAAGDYRTRRQECDQAARRFGVELLREVGAADFASVDLPAPIDRRARHVVAENGRVLEAAEALRRGDAEGFGALMDASHASMRDDFEVSTPEVDALVAIARRQPGVFGARLTGGGFGGSIVALAAREVAAGTAARIAEAYARQTGRSPSVLVPA